jgi:MFS family permease
MKMRSFWAVAAGVLFIIIVTTVVDMVLHAIKVFPAMNQPLDDRLSLIASSYRLVIGIAGGWFTARLAPRNPMKHAMILGVVGVVLGLVGVIATWNLGVGPRWYPISLAVLAIPQCWAGGRLFVSRSGRQA